MIRFVESDVHGIIGVVSRSDILTEKLNERFVSIGMEAIDYGHEVMGHRVIWYRFVFESAMFYVIHVRQRDAKRRIRS